MKEDENIIYIANEEDINKIIGMLKKYSYDDLIKTRYFRNSIIEKNTDENILKNHYPHFELIKLIALRKRIGRKSNYDIFYEYNNNAIIFAIDIDNNPPILVNAFVFYKNLKNFIEYIKRENSNSYKP